ncbi:MAG: hypothetical protein HXO04_09425 [Prevotella salivae]|uniref:hypothetical protein n=1 Tax=Segatella salivae TaxID=228604 RepID=UPI001CAFE785|nr:hypothetical protein [Segatella salivae]MBF1549727.1 hypothetical protein [Segatella salivae]
MGTISDKFCMVLFYLLGLWQGYFPLIHDEASGLSALVYTEKTWTRRTIEQLFML